MVGSDSVLPCFTDGLILEILHHRQRVVDHASVLSVAAANSLIGFVGLAILKLLAELLLRLRIQCQHEDT